MGAPKSQTLQQRFGFNDPDIKTSAHDEIMIWLDTNIELITEAIIGWQTTWSNKKIASLTHLAKIAIAREIVSLEESLQDSVDDLTKEQGDGPRGWEKKEDWEKRLNEVCERNTMQAKKIEYMSSWESLPPPDKPRFTVRKTWEKPIKSKDFIIGFIDMGITAYVPTISMTLDMPCYQHSEPRLLKHEPPEWEVESKSNWFACFEVKTAIPSLGELVRQIQMYRSYHDVDYYVVAPDDRFVKQLVAQNIGFIKYPSGEIFKPCGGKS